MSKIVLLDGHSTNPGDLSWEPIERLGVTDIYGQTSRGDLIPRCRGAEVVITNKLGFGAAEMSQLPDLKLICMLATGYDKIDLDQAQSHGITVCNAPHYSSESVAQHVFAMLLHHINHIGGHNDFVQSGEWIKHSWTYSIKPIRSLYGMTLGIYGYGAIGKKVAEIAKAFGMRVLAHSRSESSPDVEYVTQEELCRQSDVISIHTPLTPETRAAFDASLYSLMKPESILINTSRGGVLQEQDLYDHLQRHPRAMALLDVLSIEPSGREHILVGVDNCIITPHVAWANVQSRSRLIEIVSENIRAYRAGYPINVVT